MIESGCDIDLAHETFQSLLSDSNFRKQGLDCDGATGLLFPRQHHAAHSTAPEDFNHFITRYRLRPALQLFAAFFTYESENFIRAGGLGCFPATAIGAFDENQGRLADGWRFRAINDDRLFDLHVDLQHGLAALNSIAAVEKCFGYSLAINKRPIRRAQVAQETPRRRDFQQAMVAGKKFIPRKRKVSALASANQERIVLIESEFAAVVRPGYNS